MQCILMQWWIKIPMRIDPAPFWAHLFLYTSEEEYTSSLIASEKAKARHFHSTKHFIDDLCSINDGGYFGKSFSEIHPTELELAVEHQGNHARTLPSKREHHCL